MEVKINKEIRDYQESMFFGLSLRQCIFSLLAVAAAVGVRPLWKAHRRSWKRMIYQKLSKRQLLALT